MTTPPRAAEQLLQALGANSEFADVLLGDLAEEFAERAARDGEPAARRWYWIEATRSAPHLLANWMQRIDGPGCRRLARTVGTAYLHVAVVTLIAIVVASSFAFVMTDSALFGSGRLHATTGTVSVFLGLATAQGMLGGYFAARLDRDAPLACATVLALVWCVLGFAIYAIVGSAPVAVRLLHPLVLLLGAITGGLVRVTSTRGATAR
ncbi:MAG TPA: permease prefix domain 2-containing transporter [Gemmatimonadaceae bacterium]|nr:permease prefix domain 2-containing transporter [Gemmatimonadaceae bacterium]